ncbi:unnamed protein product [Owenia fusiformis]|uniref:Uncharacterized protein n=1 Tax=Owenia fusiformis TaxID=6347 RepID=A0A8J1UUQ5_OWEFU|nr:unnamed protein product [Owenia fusiformis]
MSRIRLPRQKSLIMPEVKNPFVHKIHLTWLDKIRIALMTVTVFPIRVILIVLLLLLAWPLAAVAIACRNQEGKKEPMAGWRRAMRVPLRFMGRTMFFIFGFHWVRVKGIQASAKEAQILISAPHSSFMDVIVLFISGLCSGVSRIENSQAPVLGTLVEFTQPVLVSREDPDSRANTVREIKKRAQSEGKWPQIMIFPEGTCTNRTCLINFKPGGFYPGVPVQPVCIRYPNKLDTITWTWEGPSALKIIYLTLCNFHNSIEVEFLPVYKPNQEERENPKLFAENVRELMSESLGIPVTDHTYEDCRLMMYAERHNVPAAMGLIEFRKISKKLGLDFDNLKELLNQFISICKNKEHITKEEFAEYLGVPISDTLTQMFDMYDRDRSGTIDFREYVIGLSLISQPANTDETLQLAFKLFDSNNKGYITEEELNDILYNAFEMDNIDSANLFTQVDSDKDGKITYDEFYHFAKEKPEYAALFMTFRQLQQRAVAEDPDVINGKISNGSSKNGTKLKDE